MKLSIITINYNNKDGLQKTIDSVISQTWREFEWIIIDGGSTDGSKELIEKYQEYIAYWCSEPDKGIYNAMNKGITHAKGDYISCMNSGDTFYKNDTLQKVFSKDQAADILYGDWMSIYKDHSHLTHFPSPVEIHYLYRWCFCHQAMFVRTQLLQKEGFDESYTILADRCRWTKAAFDGCSFDYLGLTVCNYDMSGISHTNPSLKEAELERIYREVFPMPILLSLNKLLEYEENNTIQQVKWLLRKGKTVGLLTKTIISLIDSLLKHLSLVKTLFKR